MGFTPQITKRQTKARKRVRSHCSTCKRPIFEGDATVWLTKPMGLSHEECAPCDATSPVT